MSTSGTCAGHATKRGRGCLLALYIGGADPCFGRDHRWVLNTLALSFSLLSATYFCNWRILLTSRFCPLFHVDLSSNSPTRLLRPVAYSLARRFVLSLISPVPYFVSPPAFPSCDYFRNSPWPTLLTLNRLYKQSSATFRNAAGGALWGAGRAIKAQGATGSYST